MIKWIIIGTLLLVAAVLIADVVIANRKKRQPLDPCDVIAWFADKRKERDK